MGIFILLGGEMFLESLFSESVSCVVFAAGFEILAFPCNQFGSQEPGTNEQILEFACTRFKAEYPIFDKVGACQFGVSSSLLC